ncbi:MAG: carboxymuconolactone decarboxylase family protein [Chitinophagaceae bacterium]|jgi:AhpD family alkylhydroperoxidase|nr:MAG: carboxymuconolactone decarboxylase family protein [Chitinophagaceae bacterium]
MQERFKLFQVDPDAYKAMSGLESYVRNTGIDKKLYELIKIRASQINGCAHCLSMHTRDARKSGETELRIYMLDAWRETDLYSEKEKAALALTEAMTMISVHGVPDEVFKEVAKQFSEKELAAVMMAVVVINGWNRIAITSHTPIVD